MLENEVNRRTADLESLQARRTSVQEQVDRATVTVVLRLPGGAPQEDRAGFLGGLEAGWDALTTSGAVLLVVVGALLPWAALLALVGVPLWWWLRRRRARRPARQPGPPGYGPPGHGPPPGPPAPPAATA
jgi:Flp pilus assembly protein TadB